MMDTGCFSGSRNDDISTMQPHQIPLDRNCVPELRRLSVRVSGHVQWLLAYFEDVYRSEQLEQFTIRGHLDFGEDVDLPTATVLRRWLAMPKLKKCIFRLYLAVFCSTENTNRLKSFYADYDEVFGSNYCDRQGDICICYPMMPITRQAKVMSMVSTQDESDDESEDDDSINITDGEVRKKSV